MVAGVRRFQTLLAAAHAHNWVADEMPPRSALLPGDAVPGGRPRPALPSASDKGSPRGHTTTWRMTPLTMKRLLDDAEGVGGVQSVDQLCQIALAAVIVSDPENADVALAYAGVRPKVATLPSRGSLQRVADVIDRLVIEAGFTVRSNGGCGAG